MNTNFPSCSYGNFVHLRVEVKDSQISNSLRADNGDTGMLFCFYQCVTPTFIMQICLPGSAYRQQQPLQRAKSINVY